VEAQSSELDPRDRAVAAPIRLLMDGRKIGDGGIGVYTENLITGLLEAGGVEVSVIVRNEGQIPPTLSRAVTWLQDEARPYSLDEMLRLPRRIQFSRFDIFHAPHYILPFGIRIPSVVTIHDLIHISHPEKFYYPWVASRLIRSAAKRADAVIAVSRHTQESVIKLTSVVPSKVVYIPNAFAPTFVDDAGSPAVMSGEKPYLFTLMSNSKPHKGLKDLLLAYKLYRERGLWRSHLSSCPPLVLAGYGSAYLEQALLDKECSELLQGVEILGVLSPRALRQRFTHATAVVIPSLVEGFCLPALEAQACGAPVVCRPVPALEELVTERDVVATDFSIEALARAIAGGVAQGAEGSRVVIEPHLARFSCRSIGEKMKGEYGRVLARRRSA